jgi:hypothetical protein
MQRSGSVHGSLSVVLALTLIVSGILFAAGPAQAAGAKDPYPLPGKFRVMEVAMAVSFVLDPRQDDVHNLGPLESLSSITIVTPALDPPLAIPKVLDALPIDLCLLTSLICSADR